MFNSRRVSLALCAMLISLSAFASAARAAAPAAVTVRVEGLSKTLIPATEVTTTAGAVVKDGNPAHSCAGTSAAGALELASSGSWNGTWFSGLGYSVETIAGETHQFEEGAAANFFWSFWLDNKPATVGICEADLQPGESVLFFPDCFSETGGCPPSPNPLGIAAPPVASAGAPIPVTVTSYANTTGAPSPAVGATVAGGGVSAVTDGDGHATLALPNPGNVTLQVSAPGSVRTETSVCVQAGDSPSCATSLSGSSDGAGGAGGAGGAAATGANVLGSTASSYRGPYALVAKVSGLLDGRRYGRGRGPRTLTGTVVTHSSVTSVALRLRRSNRGRCQTYDGTRGRFVSVRCGQGSFFKVASTPSFSYLLPESLRPGRYVLDVQASDSAGNRTTLARGTSRVVFYVG